METMKLTCRTPSPLGEILLVANAPGEALTGLYLARQKYFPGDAPQWTESPRLPLFRSAAAQLREYFAGARRAFDLALAPAGTAFQRDVWSAIAAVPFGTTITYGELARRCGRPSEAEGLRRVEVVRECHRGACPRAPSIRQGSRDALQVPASNRVRRAAAENGCGKDPAVQATVERVEIAEVDEAAETTSTQRPLRPLRPQSPLENQIHQEL